MKFLPATTPVDIFSSNTRGFQFSTSSSVLAGGQTNTCELVSHSDWLLPSEE